MRLDEIGLVPAAINSLKAMGIETVEEALKDLEKVRKTRMVGDKAIRIISQFAPPPPREIIDREEKIGRCVSQLIASEFFPRYIKGKNARMVAEAIVEMGWYQ